MNITAQQMFYFVTICKYMNYTTASQKLYITQPALSSSIARLEKELGVTLFKKKGRNIELTEHGKLVYSYMSTMVDTFNNMQNRLIAIQSDKQAFPTIRFGRNSSRAISSIIEEFVSSHPKVSVSEHAFSPLELEEKLLKEELDFIIVSPAIENSKFATKLIKEEEILLQMPKNHVLANNEQICLSDCAEEQFMGFTADYPFRQMTEKFFRDAGFQPHYRIQLGTSSLLDFRSTPTAGRYFGLFPESLCSPNYNAQGTSVFCHIKEPKCTRSISFQWLKTKPPDKLTRELFKAIENYYGSYFIDHQPES